MVKVTDTSRMSRTWSKDGVTLRAGTKKTATVPMAYGKPKASIEYKMASDTAKGLKSKAKTMVKKASSIKTVKR